MKGDIKQPYFIKPSDDTVFVCAGLYDEWYDNRQNKTILTLALITTQPNEIVANIHDRMPVILERKDWKTWLHRDTSIEELNSLFTLYPKENIKVDEVSTFVNKVSNNTIECLAQNSTKQYIQTSLF